MKPIENTAVNMKEHERHALIDCEYFPKCYTDTNDAYLCPSSKLECSTWKFESFLKENKRLGAAN